MKEYRFLLPKECQFPIFVRYMSKISVKHISELHNLELLAKQVVEGFITGIHKSPFHGFSVEFAEHKLYNKGDSTRPVSYTHLTLPTNREV